MRSVKLNTINSYRYFSLTAVNHVKILQLIYKTIEFTNRSLRYHFEICAVREFKSACVKSDTKLIGVDLRLEIIRIYLDNKLLHKKINLICL
jgi:hypothetical protein